MTTNSQQFDLNAILAAGLAAAVEQATAPLYAALKRHEDAAEAQTTAHHMLAASVRNLDKAHDELRERLHSAQSMAESALAGIGRLESIVDANGTGSDCTTDVQTLRELQTLRERVNGIVGTLNATDEDTESPTSIDGRLNRLERMTGEIQARGDVPNDSSVNAFMTGLAAIVGSVIAEDRDVQTALESTIEKAVVEAIDEHTRSESHQTERDIERIVTAGIAEHERDSEHRDEDEIANVVQTTLRDLCCRVIFE
jgi:hypothetical protein